MIKILRYLLIAILFSLCTCPSWASEDKAIVSYLEGSAFKARNGNDWRPLSRGDLLESGETVKTGARARLELTLPDKSKVRFSEKTTFKVETLLFKEEERNFGLKVFLGKIWARVAKAKRSSRFEIKTANAVAGVRGTTYRLDVNEDASSLVRVYEGEVSVGSPSAKSENSNGKKYVTGPTEIPGPHEVTREEWSYIVKSWQQISISSKGVASVPTTFTPDKDMEDWVIWNQEMDK